MLLVPQLTLYSKPEVRQALDEWSIYQNTRQKRAVFLPVLVGVSLVTAVAVATTGAGALGHSLVSSQGLASQLAALDDRVSLTLGETSTSLISLQQQLTSLAQVTLQNWQALDLLTAEKGGTCIFLQEECCYYINESGVVEQNIKKLQELQKDLHKT